MNTARDHKTIIEQRSRLSWLTAIKRAVFLRATAVAIVVGSVLTLINQFDWVTGSEPLQFLPLILVFLLPFGVVTTAQIAGSYRAHIDLAGNGPQDTAEGINATMVSHGIPARAFVIALVFGSINAAVLVADTLLHSEDLAAVSVAPLGQAYVLPLVFGLLSQTISYRRCRLQGVRS